VIASPAHAPDSRSIACDNSLAEPCPPSPYPIRAHAARYAREALGQREKRRQQYEILDQHLSVTTARSSSALFWRPPSRRSTRRWTNTSRSITTAILAPNVVARPSIREARVMVEDRLDAIKERQDPLRGMRN
jgi:hypothetical protein